MKLLHKTKQGNLHFELADGRRGAIYPATGYARVSLADNQKRMYQINPTRKVTTMHETDEILWYRTGKGWACFIEYPRPAYYAIQHTERVKYPNNLAKLTELLNNFEKNKSSYLSVF